MKNKLLTVCFREKKGGAGRLIQNNQYAADKLIPVLTIFIFIFISIANPAWCQDTKSDLVIANRTINNGQQVEQKALLQIRHFSGTGYVIEKGGSANFFAGKRIELGCGFRAETGSYFSAGIAEHNTPEALNTRQTQADVFELSVFPNPSCSDIHIRSSVLIVSIRIIDMMGNVVLEKSSLNGNLVSVDVSVLKHDYYILEVVSKEEIERMRIQKNDE